MLVVGTPAQPERRRRAHDTAATFHEVRTVEAPFVQSCPDVKGPVEFCGEKSGYLYHTGAEQVNGNTPARLSPLAIDPEARVLLHGLWPPCHQTMIRRLTFGVHVADFGALERNQDNRVPMRFVQGRRSLMVAST